MKRIRKRTKRSKRVRPRSASADRAGNALYESEQRFRALIELSTDWFWEQDENFRFVEFSGEFGKLPIGQAQWIGKCRWEVPVGGVSDEQWAEHRRQLEAHLPFRDFEYQRTLETGETRWITTSGLPIFDRSGRFRGYRGVGRDITDRKRSEDRMRYMATHDSLTGLPNRVMFNQMVNAIIETAERYGRSFGVLFVDLDRFKIINDTLGHEAGDLLLKEIAERLKQCARASDIVARLGGDEFVILVQEPSESESLPAVARRILDITMKPIVIAGQECRVTASVGIGVYPHDGRNEQTLMKNADAAMYLAKEEGRNNYQFYSKRIKTQSIERLTLETDLRRAVERQEFYLHYQPIRDVRSGNIVEVEALIRWNHPDVGIIPPQQFIPLAEETGLIVPIGQWVLQTACAQNVAWQRAGLPSLCIAVNLSPRQFTADGFLQDLAAVLKKTGMGAEWLELEITEGMVTGNIERTRQLLSEIKEMGVRVAIDDFGTGYSSLAQIKHFPIDTLKVDQSFISNILGNAEDRAITEAIIAMARALGLTVIAEGVETREQENFLRERACDRIQGRYCSNPLDADAFADFLRRQAMRPMFKVSG